MQLAWGAAFGLICTVAAISFLFLANQKAGSAYMAIFSSLDPVIGVSGAALMPGERIVVWQLVDMVLIVIGIALPNLGAVLAAGKGKKNLAGQD